MLDRLGSALADIREKHREKAALRTRREEAIRAHKERFKPTVMVVDRATMSGRYLERHADASEALARARAINAEASDDVAFVVNVNIDGWRPVEPESIYRFLKQRGVI
jgi:hypothetical protein